MNFFHYFRNGKQKLTEEPQPSDPIRVRTEAAKDASRVENGTLYRFKRDVLLIVAKLNQGILHEDCEVLKRQTIFVQTQLFHSLYNDPALPEQTKNVLMAYHLKSVKATIGDRRSSKQRVVASDQA